VQTAHGATRPLDRPATEYPTCATIPGPLHQVSYSCHGPRRCTPCRTCHLHTTRQANAILQMKQRQKKNKTKLSRIQIQTSPSQWLITIKPRNESLGFSGMLIIGESSIGVFSAYPFITVLSLLLPRIIILFLHLLSTNHKCTQSCYFPLLIKPAAQKEKMDCNSSTRSSRLRVALVVVPVEIWSLLLFCFIESHHRL
jgi:hypothetical protein